MICDKCGKASRRAKTLCWWMYIKTCDDETPDKRYDFCSKKCLLVFKDVLERLMADPDTFI